MKYHKYAYEVHFFPTLYVRVCVCVCIYKIRVLIPLFLILGWLPHPNINLLAILICTHNSCNFGYTISHFFSGYKISLF
jgi:hypothetical protein